MTKIIGASGLVGVDGKAVNGPSIEDKVHIFGTNLASLAQAVVNMHYEMTRTQLVLDAILDLNKEALKMPAEEALKQIEVQCIKEVKKTFPAFFHKSDVENSPSI